MGSCQIKPKFYFPGDDELKGYILLASRHEDREKIEIQFLTLRSACNSMMKISSAARPTVKNSFRRVFKPTLPFLSESTLEFDEDMIQKTKETHEKGRAAIAEFSNNAQRLADKKVNAKIAADYMLEVFASDSFKDESEEVKQKAKIHTQSALDAFGTAPGQNLESTQMTAWGMLTAVTYTADGIGKTPDSRLRQSWFGPNAKIKKRALELALKLI